MPDETVTILIQARDRASHVIRQVTGPLDGLAASARDAAVGLAAVGAAGTGASAGLLGLARRGGEVAGVQRAFIRTTGNAAVALKLLQDETRGLISDFDLMVGLNRAMALGSANNAEQFGELAATAITLGRALGKDAGFALESLNLGIGRQSRLILDNLGIQVRAVDAYRDYAKGIQKTVEQLSDAEKREAFRAAALRDAARLIEELGGVEETAADSGQRLVSSLLNLKDRLTELIAQSPFVKRFFEGLGDIVGTIEDIFAGEFDLGRIAKSGVLLGVTLGAGILEGVSGTLGRLPIFGRSFFQFAEAISEKVAVDAFQALEGLRAEAAAEAEERLAGERRAPPRRGLEPLEIPEFRIPGFLVPGGARPATLGESLAETFRQLGVRQLPAPGAPTPEMDLQRRLAEEAGALPPELAALRAFVREGTMASFLVAMGEYAEIVRDTGEAAKTSSMDFELLSHALVQGIGQIVQSLIGARSAGGIFGGILGGVSGILGAVPGFGLPAAILGQVGGLAASFFGRDRAQRVHLESIGPNARDVLTDERPILLTLNIRDIHGRTTAEIRELIRQAEIRDAVARTSPGTMIGVG